MDQNKIYVYAGWEDNTEIGTIYSDMLNGVEVVSFAYEQEWLQKHPSLILDPTFEQSPYRFYSKDRMLFGAFQDSCPDRWGRKLIDRRESIYAEKEGRRPQKFTETEYMLRLQDITRSGAFRFKTEKQGDYLGNYDLSVPPISSVRELEQISLGYEKGSDERWVEQLVNPGSSLGGARPKANVRDVDGSLWIAKFPSKYDDYDIGAWEQVVHDIAKECHIMVPESKLCRYSDLGSTFLVKRFDREYDTSGVEQRIHFASAMTMLGMRDGNTDGVGFLDLVDIVGKITANTDKELEYLFRRVIFDIAISNQDNHLRNHGFLLKDNKWSLSPSYDLNPVYNADYLSMNIDMDDGRRSFDKALSTASFYHLTYEKAMGIINEVSETVTELWYKLSTKYCIPEAEKRRMSPAFELAKRQAKKVLF